MAAFICRFCGAALELSDSRVCECASCGRLQSVPLLDSTEKAELFKRAEQLRSEFRYDKAIRLFEKMIQLSPTDADLYWALALCRFGVGFFADGGIALNRTQAHSFLTDNDYRQALRFAGKKQREFLEKTAERIDEKRREIAELAATEKYEVYLCCRENDQNGCAAEEVKHASELYRRLSDEKIRVFYPRVTLEDKAGSEWEPYIFGALNSARVMLIVGVNEDSFEDIRVRNAWSRLVSGDMSGKAVIPLLYGATAKALPEELSRFQAIDTSILGFEQDLIFSIKSLLSGKVSDEIPSENSPLARRAYIYLEDGEWANAENICKRLEQTQPADAALVRLLIEYRLKSEDELDGIFADIMQSENYRAAMKTGGEALRLRLKKHAVCAQYNYYTAVLNNASDAETCLSAANGFAQLGDYKDSAEMFSKANQKAELFKTQKQGADLDISDEVLSVSVKPIKKRFFTPLRTGLLIGGVCAAALGAVLICNFSGKSSDNIGAANVYMDEKAQSFERGKALFDEGKYAEAEAVFAALGDYDKSAAWVKECRYMQAEQLFSEGDFEKARSIFERLGSHNNSQLRVNDCDYALADALEKQGELKAAADAFEALDTFSDAIERKNSCRYRLALSLLDSGDDKAAEKIFGELGKYSDSKEQICKIKYSRAEKLFEKQEYSAAAEIFSALGDFSDSADRAKEAQYQQAKSLIENDNTSEAINLLSNLGDYKDSAELLDAAWLDFAIERINARDKLKAYEILTYRINDYPPAQPYIASLRSEILSGADWSQSFFLGEYFHRSDKTSAVSWKVLKTSGNMALVVSENALDYLPFDVNGSSSWSGSSLRAWLNGEFYNNVFTASEKSLIVSTTNGGVTDKLFLLSYDEAAGLREVILSPNRTYGTFYAQDKIPKGVSEVCSWGRDGLLGRKKTETGYERLSASPTEPQFVFPAMWVKIK